MDAKKRLELIKRNVVEIVGEEELKKLLKSKKQISVYHGFEPSGQGIHIGYIIGLNKHLDFQKAGLRLKILLADLHAFLNEKASLAKIEHLAELYKEYMLAWGLDPKKTEFISGTDFQLGHDYILDVLKLSLMVRMARAKRSMSIIGRAEPDPHIAQVLYPLMQAADAKYLGVDIAFGDMAQRKIHMLMKETLPRLNYKAPIAIHHEDMVGLTGGKMSSSIPGSLIMLDESPSEIKKKINKAFCPEKKIKNNPILQICKYIIFPKQGKIKIKRDKKYGGDIEFRDYRKLEKAYSERLHPLDLKNAVAESLIKILEPVRKYMSKKRIVELKRLIKEMD